MIHIAHRGNTFGPNCMENHPFHIKQALKQGFDVEVDLWYDDWNGWFLGHDNPEHEINEDFIHELYQNFNAEVWWHCKSVETLSKCMKEFDTRFNFFFHQSDDAVLTSNGDLWTYPKKPTFNNSILVVQDHDEDLYRAMSHIWKLAKGTKPKGICSDWVGDPLFQQYFGEENERNKR